MLRLNVKSNVLDFHGNVFSMHYAVVFVGTKAMLLVTLWKLLQFITWIKQQRINNLNTKCIFLESITLHLIDYLKITKNSLLGFLKIFDQYKVLSVYILTGVPKI